MDKISRHTTRPTQGPAGQHEILRDTSSFQNQLFQHYTPGTSPSPKELISPQVNTKLVYSLPCYAVHVRAQAKYEC